MFAIIRTGGKQYRVVANDLIRIEKLPGEAGSTIAFDDILAVGDGETSTLGSPTVSGASVTGEVVAQTRNDTVIVFKKRRRKNYRRRNGHRQPVTLVRITEIAGPGGMRASSKDAAPKARKITKKKAAAAAEAGAAQE